MNRKQTVVTLLSFLALQGCNGCVEDETTGTGSTTEAENAILLQVVDSARKPLAKVHVSLCQLAPVGTATSALPSSCTTIYAETWSDSSGNARIDSLPDYIYQLTLDKDSLSEQTVVSLSSGALQNLGVFTLDGASEPVVTNSNWVGTWKYTFVDSASNEEWGLIFRSDSTLSSWRYEYYTGDTNSGISYAPADTLHVEATWSDWGLIQNIFTSSDSILDIYAQAYPAWGIGNAHAILTPVVSNADSMRWTDGWVLAPLGDSLVFLGDIVVYQGSSTTLAGSSWSNEARTERAIALSATGVASITVEDMVFAGTWSITNIGKLLIQYDEGAGSTATIQKYWAIREGKLLLMDLDDPAIFYKM